MLRTLYAALRILFYFVYALIFFFLRRAFGKRTRTKLLTELSHSFCRLVMKVSSSELVVEGREHLNALPADRRVVIVSNHESYLDIPCILGTMDFPVGFIAKKELNRIPLLGVWIKQLGGVLMDRENLRASYTTITSAFDNPETRALLVFPEGTRNKTGTVAAFKAGSLRLALDNQTLVLPVTLCGGRRKFEGNGYRQRPGKIYCRIHAPRETAGIAAAGKFEFASSLHETIAAAYKEYDELLKAG